MQALASMAVKDLARNVSESSTQDRSEKYQFVELEDDVAAPMTPPTPTPTLTPTPTPKSGVVKEEFDFVKVVDLKPDVSSLDLIENVDLTNPREVCLLLSVAWRTN